MQARFLAALIGAAALTGCGGKGAGDLTAHTAGAEPDGAYMPPPALTASALAAGRRLTLSGKAVANMRVRLATPVGEAVFAPVDSQGLWRLDLAASAAPRIFGLSMVDAGGKRTVQAEGYLAVLPDGRSAQLRSGSGAVVFAAKPGPAGISAVDYDRQGGAVISGVSAPGATVSIRVDGVQRGQDSADADGRFAIALAQPLTQGDHQIDVSDGEHQVHTVAPVSPAPTLTTGPYRAERAPLGWRIDWMTPGGGMQSTIIVDRSGPAG